METQQQSPAVINPEDEINSAVAAIKNNYPVIIQKSTAAALALSKIAKIDDDKTDEIANNLLAKVRLTYDIVTGLRKEGTALLDGVKAKMMEPENKISPTNQNSEYTRVKNLRNGYANKKAEEARAAAEAIKAAKAKDDEKIGIGMRLEKAVVDGLYNAINTLSQSILTYIAGMDLDNWELKSQRFNITPKLSEKVYDSFFNVDYNKGLVTLEEYVDLVRAFKAEKTWEACNADYIKIAKGTVDGFKSSLPERKRKLEEIRENEITGNKEAAQQAADDLVQADKQAATAAENTATEAKKQAEAEIDSRADDKRLSNDFAAQVNMQAISGGAPAGSRKKNVPVLGEIPKTDIVKFWAQILMACYKNPKFKGHIKYKNGLPETTPEGFPVYTDWAAELLEFVVNETDATVPGLTAKEVIVTTARARK